MMKFEEWALEYYGCDPAYFPETEVRAAEAAWVARHALEPRWIPVTERLPNEDEPVLICGHGIDPLVGVLRWEYPTYEETFTAFRYWDDYRNDGQEFEDRVTHWMSLPEVPMEAK